MAHAQRAEEAEYEQWIDLPLEEGEMICPKCRGYAVYENFRSSCTKCWGDGKLDWVENIMGKEPPTFSSSASSTSSCSRKPHSMPKVVFRKKKKENLHGNKSNFTGNGIRGISEVFNKFKRRM